MSRFPIVGGIKYFRKDALIAEIPQIYPHMVETDIQLTPIDEIIRERDKNGIASWKWMSGDA